VPASPTRRLFNSSLEGNTRRAIDIHEGEEIDARTFKALVQAAVAHNGPGKMTGRNGNSGPRAKPSKPGAPPGAKSAANKSAANKSAANKPAANKSAANKPAKKPPSRQSPAKKPLARKR
jgi:hypothetical protein